MFCSIYFIARETTPLLTYSDKLPMNIGPPLTVIKTLVVLLNFFDNIFTQRDWPTLRIRHRITFYAALRITCVIQYTHRNAQ